MLIDNASILKYTEELSHEIVLKKPSQEIIGVLKNTRDEKLETDLIGVNTLKFSYPQKEYYSKDLKVGKLIKLKSYQEKKRDDGEGGFYNPVFYEEEFYITDIDRIDDGKNTFKVTCKSNYILLGQRVVQGYSGIKRFFITEAELSAFDPNIAYNGIKYDTKLEYENSGLLNYIMKLIPDWTLDDVGSTLENIYREVDFNEIAILDILTSFVPENYEAVIRFDTINKTITASHIDHIGEDKGLIIENDQIAKKISAKTQSTDWVTKMYVYGSDNITIAPVNPTGDDYILSLNHVLNDEFMSTNLKNAIEVYETFVNDNQDGFTAYLSELNLLEEELTTLENDKHFAENELLQLRKDLDTTIIRYANSDETPSPTTAQIVDSINVKQREIGNTYTELQEIGDTNDEVVELSESYKDNLEVYLIDGDYPLLGVLGTDYTFSDPVISGLNGVDYDKVVLTYNAYFTGTTMEEEIEAKEQEISNKVVEINALRDSLKIDANLSSAEQKELQVFIREKVYRNENITNRQELYDKGLEVMDKINSPHVEVDVDAADLLSSMKYSTEWDKVKLGNKIYVKSNVIPSEFVTMRLVGYKWELGKNKISLNLSSSNRKNEDTFELEDLLSRANNTATHISINASDYGAYVNSGERNELLSYISDKLDLSAQEAVAGHEQELSFDGGITLSNIVDDGRKIKLMNNMMVITSDGFQTADVAITPDGVIAKKLIGEIILGTTLSIKTSDESSFVVNDSGVQISNQALTITGEGINGLTLDTTEGMIITSDTDLQRTRMNAADGFIIETRELVTDEWSSAFEAITDGTISATNLILNSGKFTYGGNDLISTIGGQAIIDFTGFDTITPDAGLLEGIEIKNGSGDTTFKVDIDGNVMLGGNITWYDGIVPPDLVGEDGVSGNYVEYIFQRASTQPTVPTGVSYSAPWFDAPQSGSEKLWMSKATLSADGLTKISGWTTAVQLNADRLQTEYSIDGSTNWHTTFASGSDIYMRQSEDAGTTWSSAIRIVGEQGETGATGPSGSDGVDANLLDWVNNWTSKMTTIGADYVATVDVVAGINDTVNNDISGVFLSGDERGLFILEKAPYDANGVDILIGDVLNWDDGTGTGAIGRLDYDHDVNPGDNNAEHRLLLESAPGTALKLYGGNGISLDATFGDVWSHSDIIGVDGTKIKGFYLQLKSGTPSNPEIGDMWIE